MPKLTLNGETFNIPDYTTMSLGKEGNRWAEAINEVVSELLEEGGLVSVPLQLTDTAASSDFIINIDHNGAGSASAYAVNILNRANSGSSPTAGTGARSALVIHQYSDANTAFQIDNTRSQPALTIKNAQNSSSSNGTHGTGAFFSLWGYSLTATYPTPGNTQLGSLDDDLHFVSYDSSRPWVFRTATSAASLYVTKASGHAGPSLQVTHAGTGAAVDIDQTGAASAITIDQAGAAVALDITAGAGSAGFWPLRVAGQNFGPRFSTTTNSGNTLHLRKEGTGAGDVMLVQNHGTGDSVSFNNASREVAVIDNIGMLQLGMGNTTAPPTASSANRGKLWVQEGGTGVADRLYMCLKSAADTYSWVQVSTG